MSKILSQYNFSDKREQYNLLNTPAGKMRDHIGERLEVKAWAFIERASSDGNLTKVFMIKTGDDELIGTSSKSFIDGVENFLAVFEPEELTELEVSKGVSRGGRDYLIFRA